MQPLAQDRTAEFLVVAGASKVAFTDPKLAGAAFYKADPSTRPSVIESSDRGARVIATTWSSTVPGEAPTFQKQLPNVVDEKISDTLFKQGYREAMREDNSSATLPSPGAVQPPEATKTAVNAYAAGRSGHALPAETPSAVIVPKNVSMRR